MIGLAAWIFEYRTLPAAGAMLVWAVVQGRKYPVSQRRWFRRAPLVFAALMLGNVLYQPIKISSPQSGKVVHPGDKVQVTVELRPAFLSVLFPSVNVDLPECWSCKAPPAGVVTYGALTGSPYHFTIDLPRNLPPGVLVTSATASPKGSSHAAMRSKFVELVVK